MLTDDELSQLRTDIAETMPDSAIVQRATNTTDNYGNWSQAWANIGTVDCRIDPSPRRGSGGGMIADQEHWRAEFIMTVPYDTDIENNDRVSIASTVYEIIELHAAHSLRAVRRATIVRFGND